MADTVFGTDGRMEVNPEGLTPDARLRVRLDIPYRKMTWQEQEVTKFRAELVARVMAIHLVNGKKVDFHVLGKIYRQDQKIPEATVRRLVKQKEFKKLLAQKLFDLMQGEGVDPKYVLTKIKDAIDLAQADGDPSNMLRGAETLSKMLDMYPDKKVATKEFDGAIEADYAEVQRLEGELSELQAPKPELPEFKAPNGVIITEENYKPTV